MPTQGFQLSALPSSPQLPSNLGQVDVRGIYDNVVNALKTYETVRTSQARQKQADESLALDTEKSALERGLLPISGEAQKSKMLLATEEANAARPGVATRQAATDAAAKAKQTEAELLSNRDFRRELILRKSKTPAQAKWEWEEAILNDPESTPDQIESVRIARKQQAAAQPSSYTLGQNAEGQPLILASRGANAGALVNVATGGRVEPFNTTPTPVNVGPLSTGTAVPAQTSGASVAGKTKAQVVDEESKTKIRQTEAELAARATQNAQIKLPAAERAYTSLENKAKDVTAIIDKALKLIQNPTGPLSGVTGTNGIPGEVEKYLPGSDAKTLAEYLNTIRANETIKALGDLKTLSPSGASGFGSLTEKEDDLLASSNVSLKQGLDPKILVENLNKLKTLYARMVELGAKQRDQDRALAAGKSVVSQSPEKTVVDLKATIDEAREYLGR